MSSMRSGIVGLVAMGLFASGCRPAPVGEKASAAAAEGSGKDAGPAGDAATAAAPVDTTFRVVAQSPEPVRFFPQPDGRLLVAAGDLLYDAKPDGTLALAVPLEAFAPAMPAEESLVGYRGAPSGDVVFAATDEGGLVAQWQHATFRVTTDKLVPMDGAHLFHGVGWRGRVLGATRGDNAVAWLTGKDAAPELHAEELAVDGRGGLVVLEPSAPGGFAYVAEPGAKPVRGNIGDGRASCRLVPAADKKAYAACTKWNGKQRSTVHYRLEADGTWRPWIAEAPYGIASVAADGALWVGDGVDVRRCVPGSACTKMPMGELEVTLNRPFYVATGGDAYVEAAETTKRFDTFILASRTKLDESYRARAVEAIVARGPNDVWALVRAGGNDLVVHTGTAAAARTWLPSATDGRVLVRNTKPPTTWVGHCDQIFLRTGPAGDAEGLAKREADIKSVLASTKTESDYGIAWAVVRGRLHDKDAAGVMLWRNDVETSQVYLERVAQKLIDKLAKDPVDRPTGSCTMPVLDAVLSKS